MTVKLNRTSTDTYYSAPDNDGLTIPASPNEWCVGFILTLDGLTTGDNPQYLISTGDFQASGSFNVTYQTADAGTASLRNKLAIYLTTVLNPVVTTINDNLAGSTYLFVLQHVGSTLSVRRCPILSTNPVDGSAVVADGSGTRNNVLNGPSGLFIGARADLAANRMCDQSLGRLFYMSGTLTDLEVAKLAYGMEITELGKSPLWYARLDDANDYANRGSVPVAFTKFGNPTTSTTQPAFGYQSSSNTAPAITGTPTINGTPQVGVAIGYTPASVTGSPTPTRTQQWTVDGIDISGATGTTYTPSASDAGKSLRVRQIETNGAGSPASATSSPVTVVAASGNAVDITELTTRRVYQRGTATPLSGTYTGTTPTGIEYQLYSTDGTTVLAAWTAISGATISGGVWSGSPILPTGTSSNYRIAVRSKSGSTVLATSAVKTNQFAVGAIIGVIGSSSAEKLFDSTSGTGFTVAANTSKVSGTSFTWAAMTSTGAGTILATNLAQKLNMPVGMMAYGVSGTTLAQWLGTGTSWTNFSNAVAAVGGKLEAVYITVGSNDAGNGTITSRAAHYTNMKALVDRVRTLTGQPNLPVLWSGSNRRPPLSATQADYLRMAENDIGDYANVYHVQTIDFDLASDDVHLAATANGYPASAARASAILGSALAGEGYKRGPKISSFTYVGDTLTVNPDFRNGAASTLTPSSNFTAFTITDGTGTPSLLSSSLVGGRPTFKYDRALVSPVVPKFFSGASPDITGLLYDNGTTPLPMHVETTLTASESGAVSDTTNPVIPGTLTTSSITSTGFTVTWNAGTDNVGVTGYEVSADTGTANYTDVGNVTSRNVIGLNPATTHTVRVRAYDAAGNRSTPLTATVVTLAGADTTAPILSGVITTSNVGTSGLTFAWPAATDNVAVTGYEYSVDNGAAAYTSNGTVLTKTVSGLASDTYFTIRVRAFDAAGNRSNVLTTTVKTDAAPAGPSVASVLKNTSAPVSITPTVLTTAQIMVNYRSDLAQEIFMYNRSAAAVIVTIKGSSAGSYEVPKAAGKTIDLSGGLQISVNANSFSVFKLENARAYLDGTVTMSASTSGVVSACVVS